MSWLLPTVTNLHGDADRLRRWRYAVIETREERLVGIHRRYWPKRISRLEVAWAERWQHARRAGNHCLVYYNQPLGASNYLALPYIVSSRDCTLATVYLALDTLDEIARLKQTDAIVCEVTSSRISDRLLTRRGWEPHFPTRRGRHFIKRFYGHYPATSPRLTDASSHLEPAQL